MIVLGRTGSAEQWIDIHPKMTGLVDIAYAPADGRRGGIAVTPNDGVVHVIGRAPSRQSRAANIVGHGDLSECEHTAGIANAGPHLQEAGIAVDERVAQPAVRRRILLIDRPAACRLVAMQISVIYLQGTCIVVDRAAIAIAGRAADGPIVGEQAALSRGWLAGGGLRRAWPGRRARARSIGWLDQI